VTLEVGLGHLRSWSADVVGGDGVQEPVDEADEVGVGFAEVVDEALVEEPVEAGPVAVRGGPQVEPDLSQQSVEVRDGDLAGAGVRVEGGGGAAQDGCGMPAPWAWGE
jgi:hypothetical protein